MLSQPKCRLSLGLAQLGKNIPKFQSVLCQLAVCELTKSVNIPDTWTWTDKCPLTLTSDKCLLTADISTATH